MNEFTQMMNQKKQVEKEQRAATHAFSTLVEEDVEESKGSQVLKLLGIVKKNAITEKSVSKSIYFTPKALANLERAVQESGYPNRSRFLNAILEKMYPDN